MRLRRSTRLNEVTCTLKDTEVGNVSRVGLGGGTWAWTMRCEPGGHHMWCMRSNCQTASKRNQVVFGGAKSKKIELHIFTKFQQFTKTYNTNPQAGHMEGFDYYSDSPPLPIPSPSTVPVRRSPIRRRASLRSTPIRGRAPRSTIRRAIPSTVRSGPAGSSTAIRGP